MNLAVVLPGPDLDPGARLRAGAVRPVARAARRVPADLDARDAVLRRRRRLRGARRGGGWNEALYRTWYLTGAVWTAGWLGLGTAYLLGRTRFGYSFALCLFLAGLFTFLVRNRPEYAGAGTLPLLYFIAAGLLALAVAVETYFANDRWPILAAAAVVGATLLSLVLMATTTLPRPATRSTPRPAPRSRRSSRRQLRLLTPFLNITGAFALILGAIFSTYVFMPKRRVLAYSLDPNQPGDEFLFNLLIAPVAIIVNLVASLPGAVRALFAGQAPQPGPGDDPDRDRGVRGDPRRHAQPVRDDRVVPARQVPRRAVPVRRLPRLDRGLPRDPHAVHVDPAGSHPPRAGRRRGARRRAPRPTAERATAEHAARLRDRPDHGAPHASPRCRH